MKAKLNQIAPAVLKVLMTFIIVFPILIAIVVSFQSMEEIYKLPYSLKIESPSWDSWIYALQNLHLFRYLKNTIICILIEVPWRIFTALLAAYAFSYFDFPGKNILFTIMLMAMMIPGETVTITVFKMVCKWNLVNTYAGLCINGLATVGAVFMFRQSMLSIPSSIWEAAKIDGCSEMRYFFQMVIPFCRSIIVAQTLLSVIATYNSYLWPLLVTTEDTMRTVQTGVVFLSGQESPGYVMAAVLIVLLIPMITFLFGIDKIVEGVTAGAVKE